jgi:hypothetical protein
VEEIANSCISLDKQKERDHWGHASRCYNNIKIDFTLWAGVNWFRTSLMAGFYEEKNNCAEFKGWGILRPAKQL